MSFREEYKKGMGQRTLGICNWCRKSNSVMDRYCQDPNPNHRYISLCSVQIPKVYKIVRRIMGNRYI